MNRQSEAEIASQQGKYFKNLPQRAKCKFLEVPKLLP